MQTSSEVVRTSTRLYRRELPGAGYVAIDLIQSHDDSSDDGSDPETSRIRVYVERRADEGRREGHNPPIVAEFAGDQRTPEAGELYRMAADNVALARALIEWQSRRQRRITDD